MRNILIILMLAFFWCQVSIGAMPLQGKGQSGSTWDEVLRVRLPNNQLTKVGDKSYLAETGNGNMLVNPSFEHSTVSTGWTMSTGLPVGETTIFKSDAGKQAIKLPLSGSTGTFLAQNLNLTGDVTGAFEISQWVKTSATATSLKICSTKIDYSVTLQCQDIIKDGQWHLYTFNYPAISTLGVGIHGESVTGNIYVDDSYIGPDRNIGTVQYTSPWQSFTPTGSWTSNTTYTGRKRQVGENYEYQMTATLTGSPNAVVLVFNIPDVIDTSKIPGYDTVGNSAPPSAKGSGKCAAASKNYQVYFAGTSQVAMAYISNSTGGIASVSSTAPCTFVSGDTVNVSFSVPIVALSGSQTVVRMDQTPMQGNVRWTNTSGGNGTVTASSWTSFSDADFATNRTNSGVCTTNSSSNLSCKVPSLKAGKYEVTANGFFFVKSSTSGNDVICGFSIYDGTNRRGISTAYAGALSSLSPTDSISSLNGVFEYTSDQTNIEFIIQAYAETPNTNCNIGIDGAGRGLEINLKPLTQVMPAPLIPQSVICPSASGMCKVAAATITPTSGATCTVSNQVGSWLGATTPNATGDCTVAITPGVWPSTPICTANTRSANSSITTIATLGRIHSVSTSSIRILSQYLDEGGGTIANIINASNDPVDVTCFAPM